MTAFAQISGVIYPAKATVVHAAKAPRPRRITVAEITRARVLVCSVLTELGQITGALDTIEEIQRNPTTGNPRADDTAIAEAAGEARDAAFQIEATAKAELWALFNKYAEAIV
jgi:hypothetical protein